MRAIAQIAQLVEQWIEDPRVLGSIPSLGTIRYSRSSKSLFFLKLYWLSSHLTPASSQPVYHSVQIVL
ncbi:Conserved hypothetical protein [Candidatus Hamiltonella defensa (Bemisia tabaci)]|nr:Conserved hypothetical protein [Candidatus Hamiltonella defensa (Bemisia tabaci)]